MKLAKSDTQPTVTGLDSDNPPTNLPHTISGSSCIHIGALLPPSFFHPFFSTFPGFDMASFLLLVKTISICLSTCLAWLGVWLLTTRGWILNPLFFCFGWEWSGWDEVNTGLGIMMSHIFCLLLFFKLRARRAPSAPL